MGAVILGDLEEPGTVSDEEPVGDLDVAHGPLEGTEVEPDEVPLAIDELTLVALLGAFADGETVVSRRGGAALQGVGPDRRRGGGADRPGRRHRGHRRRVRRCAATAARCGAARSTPSGDHRLAMLGAVAGLASEEGVEVVGMEAAAVSYPEFEQDIDALRGLRAPQPGAVARVGSTDEAPARSPSRFACSLAVPAAAHATFPGGTGRIALDLHGKNLDETGQASYRAIATVKADSRGDRFVRECQVNGAGVRTGDCAIEYRSPSWAPDGRRLAFDAGRSLALMNADGTGLQPAGAVHLGRRRARLVALRAPARAHRRRRDLGGRPRDPAAAAASCAAARGPTGLSRNRIAFERGGSVYSVKPNGRGLRRIARGRDPGWAASGAGRW